MQCVRSAFLADNSAFGRDRLIQASEAIDRVNLAGFVLSSAFRRGVWTTALGRGPVGATLDLLEFGHCRTGLGSARVGGGLAGRLGESGHLAGDDSAIVFPVEVVDQFAKAGVAGRARVATGRPMSVIAGFALVHYSVT